MITHSGGNGISFGDLSQRLTRSISHDLTIVDPTKSSEGINPETSKVETPIHICTGFRSSIVPRKSVMVVVPALTTGKERNRSELSSLFFRAIRTGTPGVSNRVHIPSGMEKENPAQDTQVQEATESITSNIVTNDRGEHVAEEHRKVDIVLVLVVADGVGIEIR